MIPNDVRGWGPHKIHFNIWRHNEDSRGELIVGSEQWADSMHQAAQNVCDDYPDVYGKLGVFYVQSSEYSNSKLVPFHAVTTTKLVAEHITS